MEKLIIDSEAFILTLIQSWKIRAVWFELGNDLKKAHIVHMWANPHFFSFTSDK